MALAKNRLSVLWGLLLIPFWLGAQTPQPYPLKVPNNFLVKTVYEIIQDNITQDMWIGTEEGLYRYDGVSFQHLVHPDYSSDLSGLQQDETGRIWCHNFSGQLFYVEGTELNLFYNYANYESVFPNYKIVYPKVYVTSAYGYLEIDITTKTEKRNYIKFDKSQYKIGPQGDTLYKERINQIHEYQNTLFFMKGKALCTRTNKPLITYNCIDLPSDLIGSFDMRLEDTAYIFSSTLDQGAKVIEWSKGQLLKEIKLPKFIKNILAPSLLQDGSYFWLGLEDGLVLLDKNYKSVFGQQKILEGKSISDVVKDHEGNYWIGTLNDGIYILTARNVLVWNTNNSPLQDNDLTAMTKDGKGNLYVLERNGRVWKLNIITRKITFICDFKTKGERLFYNLYNDVLYCQYGEQAYDLTQSKWVPSYQNTNFKDISFIDENNLAYSTFRGVDIICQNPFKHPMNKDWEKPTFQLTERQGKFRLILRNKRSAFNEYDPNEERLWVGYTDGLYHYKDALQIELKRNNQSIIVSHLSVSRNGGIWAGTLGKNLLYIKDNQIVREISVGERILEVKEWNNFLFIGTNKGLIRFNLDNQNFETFNKLDGFPSDNITGLELVNDILFVTTNNGLLTISANYSSLNTHHPNIAISQVAIWEKDTLILPTYQLSAFNNNIKIGFKGRSIRSQGQLQYKYRMVGLDSNWVYLLGTNNEVRFPSLPAGNYHFEVKTVNEDGIESKEPAQLKFFIDKPYYLKWWFISAAILFLVAMISSFFLLRIRMINKRNELMTGQQQLEKELIQSHLTALRSQMNPHFMFNALNSIQEYTLTNQKELASDYLGKFSDLMRLYLNHSQVQTIALQDEIEALQLYLELEKLRFEDSLTYEIQVAKDLEIYNIQLPSMLLQPYVENAIKHGLFHKKTDRQLKIHFSKKGQTDLICTIQDNGIGRKHSAIINRNRFNKPTSYATTAIKTRLELLNKTRTQKIQLVINDLVDENRLAIGTEVNLIIPK